MAVNQSLLLQYFDVRTTPVVMGKLRGLAAGGSLAASVFVFFCSDFLPYTMMFLIVGALCMFTGVWGLFLDPTNKELPIQSKKMVFRRKYWLFYLLTLFLGARRQIFIVFALFLLVEHFRFSVNTVSVLFMINYAINWFLNPLIGRTINRIGERSSSASNIPPPFWCSPATPPRAARGSRACSTSSTTSCSISPSPCVLSSRR